MIYLVKAMLDDGVEWQFSDGPSGLRGSSADYRDLAEGLAAHAGCEIDTADRLSDLLCARHQPSEGVLMGKPGEEEQKLGDPAFLRRVASDLRHNRDLRNAMALERIADRLERAAQTPPQNTGHNHG